MSVAIVPTITRAGLSAVRNAQGTGLKAEIDAIAVGRGTLQSGVYRGYVPEANATALRGEMARLPILTGQRRDPDGFSVQSVLQADMPGEYPINEVGFYLSDGTLFALWSEVNNPLSYKSARADVELRFDLTLKALPTNLLEINVSLPDLPDSLLVLARLLSGSACTLVADLTQERLLVSRGIY